MSGVGLSGAITHRTYARAGLFGNPSDQYNGRTIAFSLTNFYAEVTLTPSANGDGKIQIQPHPVHDSTEYGSLPELVRRTSSEGLYGGVRLLTAACKRFAEHCVERGIPLRDPGQRAALMATAARGNSSSGSETATGADDNSSGNNADIPDNDGDAARGGRDGGTDGGGSGGGRRPRGFTLSYDTTVPRQTGMAGSSAIIYSTLKCLKDWYGVDNDALPYSVRPGLVLSVEVEELGIAAGLQDRVVQVYGGVVHMDFEPGHMAAHGGAGRYSRLDPGLLPRPLYILYSQNPSESGKVHSGVKARWLAGDREVRALMARVAGCGDRGLRLLLLGRGPSAGGSAAAATTPTSPDTGAAGAQEVQAPDLIPQPDSDSVADSDSIADRDRQLVDLMNENFDLRRALFGDEVLGARNLRMVELARSVGAGANFTGSGGAAVAFCPEGTAQAEALRAAAEAEGFTLMAAEVGPAHAELPPPPPLPLLS